jgi:hypothetical protein
MKLRWTSHFARAYAKAPEDIQAAFGKQSLLLLQDLRHPSLRAPCNLRKSSRFEAFVYYLD